MVFRDKILKDLFNLTVQRTLEPRPGKVQMTYLWYTNINCGIYDLSGGLPASIVLLTASIVRSCQLHLKYSYLQDALFAWLQQW